VLEHPLCKCKTLSSNPSPTKKKKEEEESISEKEMMNCKVSNTLQSLHIGILKTTQRSLAKGLPRYKGALA
jgi:hypothetical protein